MVRKLFPVTLSFGVSNRSTMRIGQLQQVACHNRVKWVEVAVFLTTKEAQKTKTVTVVEIEGKTNLRDPITSIYSNLQSRIFPFLHSYEHLVTGGLGTKSVGSLKPWAK